MDPKDFEFIQKIFLAQLHFPDTDDSDSDFDPDEYESSDSDTDDDFQDSEEEPEEDLTHIDPNNIIQPFQPPDSDTIYNKPRSNRIFERCVARS